MFSSNLEESSYFGDRSYLIEQGVVNFTNESRVDPVFDVFATTRVKDYEIGLRLTGTPKDSETTFTSIPLFPGMTSFQCC